MPDNAANIRALIARIEQLNADGTPAPPTQEDAPTSLSAEQGSTSRGPVSPTGRLPENSPPLPLNLHLVEVSDKTLHCAPRCASPGKHLDEYRAADVRPSTEQTARNNAQP